MSISVQLRELNREALVEDIRKALNKHGAGEVSEVAPDFVLAEMLVQQLELFNGALGWIEAQDG